uniref:Ovule protein n=1 Tax=Caenorhabditis tropicalis TaxID=1561998 RepID=A0A1I7V3W9_9PELO
MLFEGHSILDHFTEEQQSSMSGNMAMQKIVELRDAPKTIDWEQTISRLSGEVCNVFCRTFQLSKRNGKTTSWPTDNDIEFDKWKEKMKGNRKTGQQQ